MPVASVGNRAESTLEVTTEAIESYAEVTGDENPIHLEEAYAEETMFGGRIAHGMLVAGAISAAIAGLPGDLIYLSQDLDFESPVHPGDEVLAEAEVLEDLGDDRVRIETVAHVDGDRVVAGEAVALSVPHDD